MTTERTICLTIDDQEMMVPAGYTVYEAATEAGIHIPRFCHHEKLAPVGACRQCLVEIVGVRGLQTACTTPVREGMAVKVHTSPTAVRARRANIEFLLTNHPLDCPVCDKGGECVLQDQALEDGPGRSRYVEEKRHKDKRRPLSEFIILDQERCVLCWRCIRFLDEWADDHELDLFGRGADTRLSTFPGRPLRSKWQGNTIDLCPVGALTSRVFRFQARVWELVNTPSVCPLCAVGCNVELGVKNNRLQRITPRENRAVNDAWLCDKGRFAHAFVDHPDRLTTPLIRRDGELQPAAWDEALDLIARRFQEIVQGEGPQAIGGLGSTRVTNEANYLFQRFLRTVVGSNNVDHLGRMPERATPLADLPALERKDLFLLLGCDPSAEAPLVELWIKKAALRHGARVLSINPRRIELNRYDGAWLGYRPGSEGALLNGLARAILDAGWEGKGSRVANSDEFRAWLREYAPPQVEQMTGAPAAALRQAAEVLTQAQRPILLYGSGWAQEPANLDALENLALLLGDVETGFLAGDNNTLGALEMGVAPDLYPGRQPFRNKVRNRLAGLWGSRLSPTAGLDFEAMLAAGRQGRLQAMWIMGADPVHERREAGEALSRIPFLVVQDLFLTDTASLAEVVLPAASFAETDGSFINLTGRWQAVRAARRPPGQAQPDWWIIVALAQRMRQRMKQRMKGRKGGKGRRAWDFSTPSDVLGEIAKASPAYRGLDYARMGAEGWQPPVQPAAARRAFVPVEFDPPPSDPRYPLTLVTGRLLYDRGTLLRRSEAIQKLAPAAYVLIHPVDAEKLGLAEGEDVSVVSAQGQLGVTVKVSDEIAPGCAFAPLNLSAAPVSVLGGGQRGRSRVRLARR